MLVLMGGEARLGAVLIGQPWDRASVGSQINGPPAPLIGTSTARAQVPQNVDGPEELGNRPAARREPIGWSVVRDVAAAEERRQSLLHDLATREAVIQFGLRQSPPATAQ